MQDAEIRALAERFFGAIEAGNMSAFRDCYADDVAVWHNFDRRTKTVDENYKAVEAMVGRVSDLRYSDRRLEIFVDGFVQEHVVRAVRRDGSDVSVPAVIICRVRDGKIVSLAEYVDSADVAEIRKEFG